MEKNFHNLFEMEKVQIPKCVCEHENKYIYDSNVYVCMFELAKRLLLGLNAKKLPQFLFKIKVLL